MNLKKTFLVFIFFTFSANIYADGTSGCGLGTVLFKKKKGLIAHSAAHLINSTFSIFHAVFYPTYRPTEISMKTEISDCKYNRLVKGEREQTLFLAFNKEQIKLNISQGKGEFVHAWASLFGCPSDINARFSNILKKNYNLVFDANIPIETAISSTKKILSSDRKLEQACSAI